MVATTAKVMTSIEEKAFAPTLTPCTPGGPDYYYDDGFVSGDLRAAALPGGGQKLFIRDWNSEQPGLGHADRALRWLGTQFEVIVATGVGSIDDGEADISVVYWERQQEKGLVREIYLDDGTCIPPPVSVKKASRSP